MKKQTGFAVVEIITVVSIIAILITIAAVAYTTQQQSARDAERSAKVTVIADALERYYEENGEYPSVPSVVGDVNDGDIVAERLRTNQDAFIFPNTPQDINNALRASVVDWDFILYEGNSEQGVGYCNDLFDGSCDSFTLSYNEESTGERVAVNSRRQGQYIVGQMNAPTQPTLTISEENDTVTATSSAVDCTAGYSAYYSFRAREDEFEWSAYIDWSTASSTFVSAEQGSQYEFQVRVRCQMDEMASMASASSVVSYVHPIDEPDVMTITVTSLVDTQVNWRWDQTDCPGSSEPWYDYRWYRDDLIGWREWREDSPNIIGFTLTENGAQGFDNRGQARVKCVSDYAESELSLESNTPDFMRPVEPPADVATNFTHTVEEDRKSRVFEWDDPACGPGTREEFMYRGWADNGLYWTETGETGWHPWRGYGFWNPRVRYNLTNQESTYPDGAEVKIEVQTRCINATTGRNAEGPSVESPMFNT